MIKARIQYKDGTVENKTFKGWGEYACFTDKNWCKIKQVDGDDIRPVNGKVNNSGTAEKND